MTNNVTHVAVAVILNDRDEVLISLRPVHVHQGGLWEFPGGKVEAGESAQQALSRELNEELGITLLAIGPLIRIPHNYRDKAVLLDVWRVQDFDGEPRGREGQQLKWVSIDDLNEYAFPQANKPIIKAVKLPSRYLITPELVCGEKCRFGPDVQGFLNQLERALKTDIRIVQLRTKMLTQQDYYSLARQVQSLCQRYSVHLLLNAEVTLVTELRADGIHLSSDQLMSLHQRPLGQDKWVAASCHNREQLKHAIKIDADFAVLAPINKTLSHPDSSPLGWEYFRALTEQATIPVYALGGMQTTDIQKAQQMGGQGIAAIRSLWGQEKSSI